MVALSQPTCADIDMAINEPHHAAWSSLSRRSKFDLSSRTKIRRYGITVIYETPVPSVDVVLIHGLNDHPYRTLLNSENNVYWHRDLLPNSVPYARVMAFGYDANPWAWRENISGIYRRPAESLASNRQNVEVRPSEIPLR